MRRLNAILTVMIMIFFVIHMIWGGLILTGMTSGGSAVFTGITHLLMLTAALHMMISILLTVQTVRACIRSGVSYPGWNRLFWVRRISGFSLILFMALHAMIFEGDVENGAYRLNLFGGVQLAVNLLMVLSLLIHLSCNIGPLRISLGLENRKNVRLDILLILSVLLLLAGIAFVVYYIRWSVF